MLPRRQLKPRTFRASVGQTILVGGLARVDLLQLPAQTIYLTVWASDEVSCHYGRTDKAEERCADVCIAHSMHLCSISPSTGHNVVIRLWKICLLQLPCATGCWIPCYHQLSMLLCYATEHSCIYTVHVSLLFMVHCQQMGPAVVQYGLVSLLHAFP